MIMSAVKERSGMAAAHDSVVVLTFSAYEESVATFETNELVEGSCKQNW